ncbi:hypothetical protein Tco_0917980 [Tanacetum coccineum]
MMAGPVEGGGLEGTDDREETLPPLTKEQIEGHVSALKSLIKSHNQRNKGDPIRLDFESEDTEVQDLGIAKGKEVMDEDLRKPFKEAQRTPLTRQIIEFQENDLCPYGAECFNKPWMGQCEDGSIKSPELAKRFSNKVPTTVNEMMERLDDFVRTEESYARTELPKGEMGETHRKTSLLRKQLEMALESGKLNHLVKDVQQRGKGSHSREAPQPVKVINVISVNLVKDKKRKGKEMTKSWMNIPISFPAISSEDVSEEPLIVKEELEGYLVRRVYVDERSSVEVMFEHYFKNLNPRIKARLKETHTDLVGFVREISKPLAKIELEVCFGNGGLCRRNSMKFVVI